MRPTALAARPWRPSAQEGRATREGRQRRPAREAPRRRRPPRVEEPAGAAARAPRAAPSQIPRSSSSGGRASLHTIGSAYCSSRRPISSARCGLAPSGRCCYTSCPICSRATQAHRSASPVSTAACSSGRRWRRRPRRRSARCSRHAGTTWNGYRKRARDSRRPSSAPWRSSRSRCCAGVCSRPTSVTRRWWMPSEWPSC